MERKTRLVVLVIDSLLLPYLNAANDANSDEQLGKLIDEIGRSLIRSIVHPTVSSSLPKGSLPRRLTN